MAASFASASSRNGLQTVRAGGKTPGTKITTHIVDVVRVSSQMHVDGRAASLAQSLCFSEALKHKRTLFDWLARYSFNMYPSLDYPPTNRHGGCEPIARQALSRIR